VTGQHKVVMPNLSLYSEASSAHDMDTGELLCITRLIRRILSIWTSRLIRSSSMPLHRPHPRQRSQLRGAGNRAGIYCVDRYTDRFFWKVMLGQICASCGRSSMQSARAYNKSPAVEFGLERSPVFILGGAQRV